MAYRRGHCTGEKEEKPGAQDWYRAIDEENLARIEQASQAGQAQPQQAAAEEQAA